MKTAKLSNTFLIHAWLCKYSHYNDGVYYVIHSNSSNYLYEYIAFEIPELIGTGKSISTFSPDKVIESVKQIEKVNNSVIPLTGAGISNGDDVYASLKLGAKGALIASAFANTNKPKEVLEDMCKAVIKYLNE